MNSLNAASFKQVISALADMMPELEAHRAGMELYGALTFSVFDIFQPNENTLSRVIAELLNPMGSHGQRELFLNTMLAQLKLPKIRMRERIVVNREVQTRARRRIDLVVETREMIIGIENKPWAAQQHNQLQDYLDEIASDLNSRRPILIFLSDQKAQTATEVVHQLPYYAFDDRASLHSVLHAALQQIKAEAPRLFVTDFLTYIERKFGNMTQSSPSDLAYTDAVMTEFNRGGVHKKSMAAVLLATDSLHRKVIDEIGDYIIHRVKEELREDYEIDGGFQMSERLGVKWHHWGVRRASWPAYCSVSLESQTSNFSGVIFGIRAEPATDKKFDSGDQKAVAINRTAKQIPSGKRESSVWPWLKWLNDPHWNLDFVVRLILHSASGNASDHPFVRQLGDDYVNLARMVDDAISSGVLLQSVLD